MMYLLEQEEGGRTFFHTMSGSRKSFWKSGELPPPVRVGARLSDADFTTRSTFDHDCFRWVVWRGDGKVCWTGLADDAATGETHEVELARDERWVGRAAQHEDRGLSLLFAATTSTGETELSHHR